MPPLLSKFNAAEQHDRPSASAIALQSRRIFQVILARSRRIFSKQSESGHLEV